MNNKSFILLLSSIFFYCIHSMGTNSTERFQEALDTLNTELDRGPERSWSDLGDLALKAAMERLMDRLSGDSSSERMFELNFPPAMRERLIDIVSGRGIHALGESAGPASAGANEYSIDVRELALSVLAHYRIEEARQIAHEILWRVPTILQRDRFYGANYLVPTAVKTLARIAHPQDFNFLTAALESLDYTFEEHLEIVRNLGSFRRHETMDEGLASIRKSFVNIIWQRAQGTYVGPYKKSPRDPEMQGAALHALKAWPLREFRYHFPELKQMSQEKSGGGGPFDHLITEAYEAYRQLFEPDLLSTIACGRFL